MIQLWQASYHSKSSWCLGTPCNQINCVWEAYSSYILVVLPWARIFQSKTTLGPRLPNTCACAMCADACWRSTFSFDSPTPCSVGWRWLLPPTFSELSQYVPSGQLSPEEQNQPDERETETVNCRVQHWQVSEDHTPQSVVSEDQGMRHDTNQYSDNTMSQNTDVQMEL